MIRRQLARNDERRAKGLCIQCCQPSEIKRCGKCAGSQRTMREIHSQSVERHAAEQQAKDNQCRLEREFINRHLHLITNQRGREILTLRYGYTNDECMTLEEVGVKYGITRERVRQIQSDQEEIITLFTIEKDIPVPGFGRSNPVLDEMRDTLRSMEPGDSFCAAENQQLQTAIGNIAKQLNLVVTTRKLPDNKRRVWLVAKSRSNNGNS